MKAAGGGAEDLAPQGEGEGGDLVHMEYKMVDNTHTVLVYRTQIHSAGLAANMLTSRQFTNQSGVSTKC